MKGWTQWRIKDFQALGAAKPSVSIQYLSIHWGKKKKEREEKEEKKDTHNIPFCNLCIIKRDTAHVLDYTSYQHFLLDRGQLGQHHNLCKQPVRAILQPHKSKPLEDKVEEGEETFP